jgi:cystathionine beta-lyase/cystathionine gamma-synthase
LNIELAIHFIPVGIATASGLAALTTLTHLLRAGDHVVVCDDVYGGRYDNIQRLRT